MDAPASYAKADVASWAAERAQRQVSPTISAADTRNISSRCAELAYDWARIRAGELDPGQEKDAIAACAEYVTDIYKRAPVKVGIITMGLLWWLLPKLILFVVELLLRHILTSPQTLQGWQEQTSAMALHLAPPKGLDDGESELVAKAAS